MSVKTFLDLVEIKTKLASLTPFVIGVLFTLSYFNEFHVGNTIIFLSVCYVLIWRPQRLTITWIL